MLFQTPQTRTGKQTVAVMIMVALLLPHISWAGLPLQAKNVSPAQNAVTQLTADVQRHTPATVVQANSAAQGKTIIHIQDLHCNHEVQRNIARLLNYLAKEKGVRLVGEEGAFENVYTGKIRTFPVKRVREKVADYFVRQGNLTGAEYYAAVGDWDIALVGVETPALYDASEEAVRAFVNDESLGYCRDLLDVFEPIKDKLYSPEQKELDKMRSAFLQGRQDVMAYGAFLYRKGKAVQMDLDEFPQLTHMLNTIHGQDRAATEDASVYMELEILEKKLRNHAQQTPEQAQLDDMVNRVEVMEKLLNISATVEEVARFKQEREQFRVAAIAGYLQQQLPDAKEMLEPDLYRLDAYLDNVDRFYRLADQRSRGFVENLIRKMDREGETTAVLITGGYHTQDVLQALRENNVSFISITPEMHRHDVTNPYFALLRNHPTLLEELLAKSQTIMALRTCCPDGLFQGDDRVRLTEISNLKAQRFHQSAELLLETAASGELAQSGMDAEAVLAEMEELLIAYPDNEPIGIDLDRLRKISSATKARWPIPTTLARVQVISINRAAHGWEAPEGIQKVELGNQTLLFSRETLSDRDWDRVLASFAAGAQIEWSWHAVNKWGSMRRIGMRWIGAVILRTWGRRSAVGEDETTRPLHWLQQTTVASILGMETGDGQAGFLARIKAWMGDPLLGAPVWEVLFSLPVLAASIWGADWPTLILTAVSFAWLFSQGHPWASQEGKRQLFVFSLVLAMATLLPVLFFGPSVYSVAYGLQINVLLHSAYNRLAMSKGWIVANIKHDAAEANQQTLLERLEVILAKNNDPARQERALRLVLEYGVYHGSVMDSELIEQYEQAIKTGGWRKGGLGPQWQTRLKISSIDMARILSDLYKKRVSYNRRQKEYTLVAWNRGKQRTLLRQIGDYHLEMSELIAAAQKSGSNAVNLLNKATQLMDKIELSSDNLAGNIFQWMRFARSARQLDALQIMDVYHEKIRKNYHTAYQQLRKTTDQELQKENANYIIAVEQWLKAYQVAQYIGDKGLQKEAGERISQQFQMAEQAAVDMIQEDIKEKKYLSGHSKMVRMHLLAKKIKRLEKQSEIQLIQPKTNFAQYAADMFIKAYQTLPEQVNTLVAEQRLMDALFLIDTFLKASQNKAFPIIDRDYLKEKESVELVCTNAIRQWIAVLGAGGEKTTGRPFAFDYKIKFREALPPNVRVVKFEKTKSGSTESRGSTISLMQKEIEGLSKLARVLGMVSSPTGFSVDFLRQLKQEMNQLPFVPKRLLQKHFLDNRGYNQMLGEIDGFEDANAIEQATEQALALMKDRLPRQPDQPMAAVRENTAMETKPSPDTAKPAKQDMNKTDEPLVSKADEKIKPIEKTADDKNISGDMADKDAALFDLKQNIAEMERYSIRQALRRTQNSDAKAALLLDMPHAVLFEKIQSNPEWISNLEDAGSIETIWNPFSKETAFTLTNEVAVLEKAIIGEVLFQAAGDRAKAAQMLGWNKKNLNVRIFRKHQEFKTENFETFRQQRAKNGLPLVLKNQAIIEKNLQFFLAEETKDLLNDAAPLHPDYQQRVLEHYYMRMALNQTGNDAREASKLLGIPLTRMQTFQNSYADWPVRKTQEYIDAGGVNLLPQQKNEKILSLKKGTQQLEQALYWEAYFWSNGKNDQMAQLLGMTPAQLSIWQKRNIENQDQERWDQRKARRLEQGMPEILARHLIITGKTIPSAVWQSDWMTQERKKYAGLISVAGGENQTETAGLEKTKKERAREDTDLMALVKPNPGTDLMTRLKNNGTTDEGKVVLGEDPDDSFAALSDIFRLSDYQKALESYLVQQALYATGGSYIAAAKLLGLSTGEFESIAERGEKAIQDKAQVSTDQQNQTGFSWSTEQQELGKAMIEEALYLHKGREESAAGMLGISVVDLKNKYMPEYKVSSPLVLKRFMKTRRWAEVSERISDLQGIIRVFSKMGITLPSMANQPLFEKWLAQWEYYMINMAMYKTGNKTKAAAALLGMPLTAFQNKRSDYTQWPVFNGDVFLAAGGKDLVDRHSIKKGVDLKALERILERELMLEAMYWTHGNHLTAAKLLGINGREWQKRMKRYGSWTDRGHFKEWVDIRIQNGMSPFLQTMGRLTGRRLPEWDQDWLMRYENKSIADMTNKIMERLDENPDPLDRNQLKNQSQLLRKRIQEKGLMDETLMEGVYLFAKACQTVLGIGLYAYQIESALFMLAGESRAIEQPLGSGKTETMAAAAYLNALEGKTVEIHVVRSYLARVQGEKMGEVFNVLGVKSGIRQTLSDETKKNQMTQSQIRQANQALRQTYQNSIIYGLNTDFFADNLTNFATSSIRERIRPYDFPDVAYVDDARSPLINDVNDQTILARAGQPFNEVELFRMIMGWVETFEAKKDFMNIAGISLTQTGRQKVINLIEEQQDRFPKEMADPDRIIRLCNTALEAATYKRDIDYALDPEEGIVLISPTTGEFQPMKRWNGNIYEFVSLREGIDHIQGSEPFDMTSSWGYYRQTPQVRIMDGLLEDVIREIQSQRYFDYERVQPKMANQRTIHPYRLFATQEQKHAAILAEVTAHHEAHRPVVVGSRYLKTTQTLAQKCTWPHAVFTGNEKRWQQKEILTHAGQPDAVTFATIALGVGADIRSQDQQTPAVLIIGELLGKNMEAQYAGRVGRMEPGQVERYFSLEDEFVTLYGFDMVRDLLNGYPISESGQIMIDESKLEKMVHEIQLRNENKTNIQRAEWFNKNNLFEAYRNQFMELKSLLIRENMKSSAIDEITHRWGTFIKAVLSANEQSRNTEDYQRRLGEAFFELIIQWMGHTDDPVALVDKYIQELATGKNTEALVAKLENKLLPSVVTEEKQPKNEPLLNQPMVDVAQRWNIQQQWEGFLAPTIQQAVFPNRSIEEIPNFSMKVELEDANGEQLNQKQLTTISRVVPLLLKQLGFTVRTTGKYADDAQTGGLAVRMTADGMEMVISGKQPNQNSTQWKTQMKSLVVLDAKVDCFVFDKQCEVVVQMRRDQLQPTIGQVESYGGIINWLKQPVVEGVWNSLSWPPVRKTTAWLATRWNAAEAVNRMTRGDLENAYDLGAAFWLENSVAALLAGMAFGDGSMAWMMFGALHMLDWIGSQKRRSVRMVNTGLAILLGLVNTALGVSPLSLFGLLSHLGINILAKQVADEIRWQRYQFENARMTAAPVAMNGATEWIKPDNQSLRGTGQGRWMPAIRLIGLLAGFLLSAYGAIRALSSRPIQPMSAQAMDENTELQQTLQKSMMRFFLNDLDYQTPGKILQVQPMVLPGQIGWFSYMLSLIRGENLVNSENGLRIYLPEPLIALYMEAVGGSSRAGSQWAKAGAEAAINGIMATAQYQRRQMVQEAPVERAGAVAALLRGVISNILNPARLTTKMATVFAWEDGKPVLIKRVLSAIHVARYNQLVKRFPTEVRRRHQPSLRQLEDRLRNHATGRTIRITGRIGDQPLIVKAPAGLCRSYVETLQLLGVQDIQLHAPVQHLRTFKNAL